MRWEDQPVLCALSNLHDTHKHEPLIVNIHPHLADEELE